MYNKNTPPENYTITQYKNKTKNHENIGKGNSKTLEINHRT